MLAILHDGECIAVQLGCDLAIDTRHDRDIPAGLGKVKAAQVPGMDVGHSQVAGGEKVALVELVAVLVVSIWHEVIFPNAIIVPFPGIDIALGDDCGFGSGGIVGNGSAEERGDTTGICPLIKETELDDTLGIESCVGGIIAGLVNGQFHGQVLEVRQVPRLAVIHFTNLVRRVRQLGFIEQFLVVIDEGREQGKRNANQNALILGEFQQFRVVFAQIEASFVS